MSQSFQSARNSRSPQHQTHAVLRVKEEDCYYASKSEAPPRFELRGHPSKYFEGKEVEYEFAEAAREDVVLVHGCVELKHNGPFNRVKGF